MASMFPLSFWYSAYAPAVLTTTTNAMTPPVHSSAFFLRVFCGLRFRRPAEGGSAAPRPPWELRRLR